MNEPKAPLEVIDGPWGYACREADAVFIPAVSATPDYPLRRVLRELFERTGETRMVFSAILNPDDLRPRLRNIVREWDEYVEYMDDYSHCIEIRYELPVSPGAVDPVAAAPCVSPSTRDEESSL
jgi:hypothetical protein